VQSGPEKARILKPRVAWLRQRMVRIEVKCMVLEKGVQDESVVEGFTLW
jgi:hypothetical protein